MMVLVWKLEWTDVICSCPFYYPTVPNVYL
jgi:hypothetical protein